MYKLSVWQTIKEAYAFIWAERRSWLTYGLGPVILVCAAPFLLFGAALGLSGGGFQAGPGVQRDSAVGFVAAIIAFLVILIVVYIAFAVAWHRRYLVGPDNTSARELIKWERRHWSFLGRGVLFVIIGLLVMAVFWFPTTKFLLPILSPSTFSAGSGNIGTFLAVLIGIQLIIGVLFSVVMVGFLLTFPAASVADYELTITRAWSLASGNRWRMFWVFTVGAYIPIFIVQIGLEAIPTGFAAILFDDPAIAAESTLIGVMTTISGLLVVAVVLLGFAIGISLLSIMYRRLRDNVLLTPKGPVAKGTISN